MPDLALVRKEIPAFLGVNLRQDRMDLADEELAKAINADLHSFPGTIVLRYGRTKQFSTALSDLVIRRLAKVNSKRYQVAGQSLYRDQAKIINGLLSSNLVTTIIPFRPLNDNTIWAFIADDSVMRKDDGTNTRIWGIAAPATTERATVQASKGALTGTYAMKYTWLRKTSAGNIAHESNPSPVSLSISLTTQMILISGITTPSDPQITHARFYRTVAGGTAYLFEAEVRVNAEYAYTYSWEADHITPQSGNREEQITTQVYASRPTLPEPFNVFMEYMFAWEKDTILGATTGVATNSPVVGTNGPWSFILAIADSALGAAVETDNDVPPVASWVVPYEEHVFFLRDASNPHYLWYSKRFRPESVPTDQFLEVGNADDPLQCGVPIAGLLGIFTKLTKYRLTGNSTSGFIAIEAISHRGTPCYNAPIPTEYGVVFPARDGVFVTNFISPDTPIGEKILPLFMGETVNDLSPINWNAPQTMAAAAYKQRYYLSYPSGSNTTPDKIAIYSRDTQRWYFYDHPMRSLFVEEDVDDLVAGGVDGFVFVLEDGATDAGSNIAMDAETKDYFGDSINTRKLFMYYRVDADALSGSITAAFYVDGVLKRTATITGTRTKTLIRIPEGSMGYQWRVKFTHTGSTRVKVYGVTALWLPMGTA